MRVNITRLGQLPRNILSVFVVSNVITPAQVPVTSEHTCLDTVEANLTAEINVLTPAQIPVTSEASYWRETLQSFFAIPIQISQ